MLFNDVMENDEIIKLGLTFQPKNYASVQHNHGCYNDHKCLEMRRTITRKLHGDIWNMRSNSQIYYGKNASSFNIFCVTTGNNLWKMKTMEEQMCSASSGTYKFVAALKNMP
jgi:hypothetical protein